MPTIPNNFDGQAFAEFYNLNIYDFTVDGLELTCPSLPELTDEDLSVFVVDLVAYEEEVQNYEATRQEMIDEYESAVARLTQIVTLTKPATFTQVEIGQMFDALQDMARYERFILKLLARPYLK